MGKYTNIKSKLIKEKLKKADWKKGRDYIDNLVFLENSITGKIYGLGANIKLGNLRNKYKKEYYEIFKELKPKEFKEYIKREMKEREKDRMETEKFEREERKEKNREKDDWDKAKKKLKAK